MNQLGKLITIFGILLVVLGLIISYGKDIPIFRNLGHLPGDLIIKKDNFTLYVPWVTCLVLSLIIYVIFNIIRR